MNTPDATHPTHSYPWTRSRRDFLKAAGGGLTAAGLGLSAAKSWAQTPGQRPTAAPPGVTVLNPQARVPVSFIIDDSTCLVNLNKFAMPQFAEAFGGTNKTYDRNWREWPDEIPDAFVRKFGEWCAQQGVKGKYSIVPYPACVGRLDRLLPGWSNRDLQNSLDLVRTLMMPNWDIHPEMITHTRVIDLKTGHPYPDPSRRFMENWDWTRGRSVDELAAYMAYALNILKTVGLPCEGITTPGGFGNQVLPELAQATLESCRDVFQAEIPHYFRHLYSQGDQSVAPRVEYVSGLNGPDPRCVVSIIGCTGDWTGGWDNVPPGGADRFITEDLKTGRMVEVIGRDEPAIIVAHWTGIHWNGEELGFNVFKEVVRRLHAKFDNILWMKLSEIARYWAARELTQISHVGDAVAFDAPFATDRFTLAIQTTGTSVPRFEQQGTRVPLEQVSHRLKLRPGSWVREAAGFIVCFDLPKGNSHLRLVAN